MEDVILNARLDLLEQNLNTAIDTTVALEADLKTLGLSQDLTNLLSDRFKRFGWEKKNRVEAIRKLLGPDEPSNNLSLQQAWKDYATLCEQSSQGYVEFLEAILGVAIRVKRIDQDICMIADELLRGMRGPYVETNTLTIPASREAYSQTLAKLVRLRFPEWTLWSLPLIAHEFGYMIQEIEQVCDFIESLVKRQSSGKGKKKNKDEETRARSRAQQLLADASAVYTIGPCYPCSLITLRLTPIPCSADITRAPDAERAVFVLEMLRQMDSRKSQLSYATIVEKLESQWTDMVRRSGAVPLTPETTQELKDLAALVKTTFDDLLAGTQYPLVSGRFGSGWDLAVTWSEAWNGRGRNAKLEIPAVTEKSKLHDALNAAWAYRLIYEPKPLDMLEQVAMDLCKAIIAKRAPASSQSTLSDAGKMPATAAAVSR